MRNFLTILKRYKTSSILNILGLAVAFASLYIILVQVHYDLTYNKAIPDCERVYQVELFDDYSGKYSAWMSRPMAEAFMRDCPVIEKYGTGYIGDMENIAYDCCMDKEGSLAEFRVGMGRISTQWLDVFGYRAVSGSFSELEKPKSIAVSQNIAKKLGLKVGDHIYNGLKVDPNKMSMVVAIYNDLPVQNTDLNNIDMVWNLGNQSMDSWSEWSYNYWIKLRSTADVQAFYDYANKKYREILAPEGKSEEEIAKAIEEMKLRIIPITDTYFATDSENPGRSGNKTTTFTLLSIAILVVLIALINFINFFFALVPVRIRSVNTRKVFGCSAARLRADFILESIGIIIISLLLSWACVDIIKSSAIANYIGAPLNLSKNLFPLGMTLVAALTIALSGSIYPSFYITSFPAAMVLKGSFSASKSGKRLRMILIGLQFTISIGLIIATMFIKMQHNYMMQYNMGFNKEMLLSSYIPNKIISTVEQREAFANKLKENPQIKDLSFSDGNLIAPQRMGWGREFKDKEISLQCMPVSWDFLRFIGIEIVEGRDFSREDEFKENGTFILNQTACKEYEITLQDKLSGHNGPTEIAGICKDFNFKPLQYGITPFSFYVFGAKGWRMPQHLYLRTTQNADIPAVIEYLKNTIMDFSPDTRRDKLEVEFFDQELGRQYKSEQKLTALISLFTALSIIISLMGVFGLVLFETQYKRKEIGLRRVHGSTVGQILGIFNIKFVKIILACFVIATPLSYIIVDHWLSTFAYRTPIHWWVFAIALCVILLITVVIVTLRSLKAATDNPIDAIRTEG